MNRVFKLVFLYMIFFVGIVNVQALTGVVNVNDSLTLRDKPSTSGRYITSFYNNTELTIIDSSAGSGNGCPNNWYRVSYGSYTGYSCGTYITLKQESIPIYDSEDDSYLRSNYSKPLSSDGSIMCYEDAGSLSLRSSVGGSRTGVYVNCGDGVSVLGVVDTPNTTCPYWYQIKYNNNTGYVCGYFVNTTKLSSTAVKYYNNRTNGDTFDSYQNKLSSAGFPSSYFPYLLELHARHPNWNFQAEKINLNYDDVVIGENGNGASLLEQKAFGKGYLSLNSNTYNVNQDKYSDYSGEPGYANASREAIAYFVDPRNYLNEKYIFAFETLTYSNNQTLDVVNAIIRPQAFWNRLYGNGSIGASESIVNSSKSIGISAVHVASRIKQEMGNGDYNGDSRVGGTFTYDGVGRSGYYNFFNIKSWSGRGSSIYAAYAYENGWNTSDKGIHGGAAFMYDGYISVNQDTIYYEKFDVSTNNGNYTHQYMQNLAAPVQEGGIKYNGYKNENASYLGTGITFVIPVYINMPSYVVTAPRVGSVNNYLSSLKIDGVNVNGFNYKTYNYNVYLKSGVSSVNISASTFVNIAKISNIGNINITSDNQIERVVVTSENGKMRVYTINFIREKQTVSTPSTSTDNHQDNNVVASDNKVSVADVMNHSGFKYNVDYIFGISEGTNVSKLIGNVTSYNRYVTISIQSASGSSKSNDIFKTGDKVTIGGSDGNKVYTAIIYGDVNGDGKISAVDYVSVKNQILKENAINGIYLKSADVNKDGKVSAVDYVTIKNQILGRGVIPQ